MNKNPVLSLLFLMIALNPLPESCAEEYEILQLTHNSHYEFGPQINNTGWVAWTGDTDSGTQVFLYDGASIRQITEGDQGGTYLQINDRGWLAWQSGPTSEERIHIYDGTSVNTLPEIEGYRIGYPQLNNLGQVLTWGNDDSDREIFLFEDMQAIQLTDNDHTDLLPQLNDNGWAVWVGHDGSDHEIFLYNGTDVVQLTDNDDCDYGPHLSNNGHVVWSQRMEEAWIHDVFLHDGSETIRLTDDGSGGEFPQVNDNGQVAWCRLDEGDYEIFFHDGDRVIQITDNDYDDGGFFLEDSPRINNSGHIVWATNTNPSRIFLYNGEQPIKLAGNSADFYNPPGMNDHGAVVWEDRLDGTGVYEIVLALPGPSPWGPASQMGTSTSVRSSVVNCVLLILVPGTVLLLIRRWTWAVPEATADSRFYHLSSPENPSQTR